MNFLKILTTGNVQATMFLYLIGSIFGGVIAYQMVIGHSIDTIAVGFMTTVIGYAIHSTGNQQGTDNANNTVAKTAIAQYPLTPEGIAQSTSPLVSPPTTH